MPTLHLVCLGLTKNKTPLSKSKQDERSRRVDTLTAYHGPITDDDRTLIARPIADIVQNVHDGTLSPLSILHTYGRIALHAHAKTNCLTEIMLVNAEQAVSKETSMTNFEGPLAGIPVSLKDTLHVAGYDSSVGYSAFTHNPAPVDGSMTRLLRNLGAIPYVKTNVPTTLLSFESANDVWGRCTNAHNSAYSPGGSSGGESALLAMGARIGIGSDVAGSVRIPAHFSGIYALRCCTGRWPRFGGNTSMPGQEGVPAVYSPMARTLDDLVYFSRAVLSASPWKYDHSIHPLPWRNEVAEQVGTKKLRIGIMRTDGVVDPSPACVRALEMTEAALLAAGHEIVEITPPSPRRGLVLSGLLISADGCSSFAQYFRAGEQNDSGAAQLAFFMRLPEPVKFLYYLWVRFVRRDKVWAELVRDWHPKTAFENWQLVAKREAYRMEWFDWWNGAGVDVLLTPPFATPATPHGAMKDAVAACGYTFLFNLVSFQCVLKDSE